jgi:ABC-type glycerol-3-phosphate transport system permease component
VIRNRPEIHTLSVRHAFNEGAPGTEWGGVTAGSTQMSMTVFVRCVQRGITTGITAGPVKGTSAECSTRCREAE